MTWTAINFDPGIYPDDTPRTTAGFFIDGDKVRFVRGKAQSMGGWELATTDTVEGICRGMFAWRSNDTLPQAAIGTTTHLQAYYDGDIYDITPAVSYTHPTFNVTTTNGSATVTISSWTHGMVANQRFEIAGASPATVGGVTLDGAYEVLAVSSASAITFTAAQAATSSAGPTSVTCDATIYIASGQEDGTAGAGYGVGPYGGGDYGEPATLAEYYPRTWSFDAWGQNLLACPRGGKIYEWSPAYSNPELVTNGDFASGTGWTTGTGWTIGAGVATATAGSASMLEQTITLAANAYFLLEFDYTRSAGTLQPRIGTTAIGSALSSASGKVREVFYTGSGTLNFNKDASFAGTVDNVSVKQLLNSTALPNAPSQNTCILVTPELIVLALGTIDADTGAFNPMQIRSSDTGDGDLTANRTWTVDPANLSRRWNLSRGSRIVRGLNGNGEVLVWTDTALYSGTYTTDTNIVYRWRLVGEGCGLIGPNAVIVENGVARWINPAGDPMEYVPGGVPRSLNCPMVRLFKDNLAPSQQEKIYASPISQFGDGLYIYPDFRDGNECSRYILHCTREPGSVWALGTFERTAWLDAGVFPYVLAVSTDGELFWQEKGKSADAGPLSGYITTGALNKGRTMVEMMGMVPDFEDLVGGVTVTVYATPVPNGTAETFGPYDVTSVSEQIDIRALGYSPTVKIAWNSAPAFVRMGSSQFDMRQTGAFR
jgi:hypothetical protein